MKNIRQHKSISFEDALKDASLVHFHEAIRSVQNKSNKDISPKKYEKSMLNLAESDTVRFFKENPNMSIKTIVAAIIQSFPDEVSPDMILKMTKKIVEKWQSLSSSYRQETQAIVSV